MTIAFTTKMAVPFDGPVDLERVLRELPPEYQMKGMFFERQRTVLGPAWSGFRESLSRPPARAYANFERYPTSDYLKLLTRVAEDRFGKGKSREGVRLLARGDVEVFTSSTLGRVTFAMLREPGAALLRYPDVSGVLVHGPKISAKRAGDRAVTVTYTRYHGLVEYVVGALEGLVAAFDEEPRLDVKRTTTGVLSLDVTW